MQSYICQERAFKEYNDWLRKGVKIKWVLHKNWNKWVEFRGLTGEKLEFKVYYSKSGSGYVALYESPDFGNIDADFFSGRECKKYALEYLKRWKLRKLTGENKKCHDVQ